MSLVEVGNLQAGAFFAEFGRKPGPRGEHIARPGPPQTDAARPAGDVADRRGLVGVLALARVERAGPQWPRLFRRLVRVDDVVDLAEALRIAFGHIGRTVRETFEAPQVGGPEVEAGHAFGQPFG